MGGELTVDFRKGIGIGPHSQNVAFLLWLHVRKKESIVPVE